MNAVIALFLISSLVRKHALSGRTFFVPDDFSHAQDCKISLRITHLGFKVSFPASLFQTIFFYLCCVRAPGLLTSTFLPSECSRLFYLSRCELLFMQSAFPFHPFLAAGIFFCFLWTYPPSRASLHSGFFPRLSCLARLCFRVILFFLLWQSKSRIFSPPLSASLSADDRFQVPDTQVFFPGRGFSRLF